MNRTARLSAVGAGVTGLVLGAIVSAVPVHAAGGNDPIDIYEIAISFHCNNPSFCGPENLSGTSGRVELVHDVRTGQNTGAAEITAYGHVQGSGGADHDSVVISDWWVAPGHAGPSTLYTSEVDTIQFRGQTYVESFSGREEPVNLVPGHQSTTGIFGIQTPPGVAAELQISYTPH